MPPGGLSEGHVHDGGLHDAVSQLMALTASTSDRREKSLRRVVVMTSYDGEWGGGRRRKKWVILELCEKGNQGGIYMYIFFGIIPGVARPLFAGASQKKHTHRRALHADSKGLRRCTNE